MQLLATSLIVSQQASAVLSAKAILSQQAAEAVDNYLRHRAAAPAASPSLPAAAGFFTKLLALVR